MWTIERVRKELDTLAKADGITIDVPVSANGRLRTTLGRVRSYRSTCLPISIEFSQKLLNEGTDNDILNTVKHEYVHYFLLVTTGENHGHDYMFKAKCAEIGCTHNKTRNDIESEEMMAPTAQSKYEVYCPDCNETIGTYSRMCKTLRNLDNCSCGICGGKALKMIQNW